MILLITKTGRVNKWCDTFGIDRHCQSNKHIYIVAFESGYNKWESQIWELALIDNGVRLSQEDKNILTQMSREVRWMDTIDWSLT